MTVLERKLERAKKILLRKMRLTDAYFSVHIVPDKEMERLRTIVLADRRLPKYEREKIRKEEQVNVLSFPEPKGFPHPETDKISLGEVYLNREFGGGKAGVLGPLFIHGFLHLLGYRHFLKRDTIEMEKLERKLWAELASKIL